MTFDGDLFPALYKTLSSPMQQLAFNIRTVCTDVLMGVVQLEMTFTQTFLLHEIQKVNEGCCGFTLKLWDYRH